MFIQKIKSYKWSNYNIIVFQKEQLRLNTFCIFNLNNIEQYTIINNMQIDLNPENNK